MLVNSSFDGDDTAIDRHNSKLIGYPPEKV